MEQSDKLKLAINAGPILTITPPVRRCYLHGNHSAWVQFHFDKTAKDHYCIPCIVHFLDTHGIGRVADSAPATHIGKKPSPNCEHVWHADGDYDRCDLCHGQKKREPQ